MRVIITGGTGKLGTDLAQSLLDDGHEVTVLSRSPKQKSDRVPDQAQLIGWDAQTATGWADQADGCDVIVNFAGEDLAGESFFPRRWTDSQKRRIMQSRAHAGQAIVQAVERAQRKPGLVVQASASGYYGTNQSQIEKTEDSPAGDDFLAQVCLAWEQATEPVEAMGVRRVIIRTGLVLDPARRVLPRLLLPYKLFVGGPLGTGRQYYPWIHKFDEVRAIRFLMGRDDAQGAFNLSAPNPVQNEEFCHTLGRVMGRPSIFRVPSFAFRLAFGEVATVVVNGQRMVPHRLRQLGFEFRFPELEAALQDLLT